MNIPHIKLTDLVDIAVVAYLIYKIVTWIKDTRAWTLFKGILVIFIVSAIAFFLQLNTLLWIFSNTISVGIIAVIVVFQPELRKALEQLGRGHIFSSFLIFEDPKEKEKLNTNTIEAVIKSVDQMSSVKTGALIVFEQEIKLGEHEQTGITIDAAVTSQLLLNIFEHNTPLHDGAVIIKNNRIAAATCYLPLTESQDLSKDLGTRHRAAIGVSEVSDAIVVIVSEETGAISVVKGGTLTRNIEVEIVRNMLMSTSKKKNGKNKLVLWKGRHHNE